MSAIATKIVEKYNLTSKTSVSKLSQYTSDNEQVSILIPNQRSGKAKVKHKVPCSAVNLAEVSYRMTTPSDSFQVPDLTPQNSEETIRDLAQRILRDKLSIKDIRVEARALANSAPNANAGSSRLSRLRRELKNLGASFQTIEATKFPDITKDANEIQKDRRKFVEAFERIDYPDHFTLESVKERLDKYDISTPPDLQALADVMIMLCIRPAELTTLCITNAGVTGYAKNRGQPDIPRKFRSIEKNQERAKELLTWIQNAISSGRIGDPGAVYAVVVHGAKNLAHAMTIAGEALRHNPDNNTSPAQNYVVLDDSESDSDETR
ncbi:13300_t:CDS:2, partial [Gigaspora rosea]